MLHTASHCFTSKLMLECLNNVNELSERNNVRTIWVPGHQGIAGNEKADELAREGSNKKLIGPEPAFGITYASQRQLIRDTFTRRHDELWKRLDNRKHCKNFIVRSNKRTTNFLLNKSRIELRSIIGLITGHRKLSKHLHKMTLSHDSSCRRCNEEEETPIHLFINCPALVATRRTTTAQQEKTLLDIELVARFKKEYLQEL